MHLERFAFGMQAADDVEAGLASNLEAALTARYNTLQATFLASALYQLAGSDFNLLACVRANIWQSAMQYEGAASLVEALLGCFETKSIPELHRLQGLSWTLCHHAHTDQSPRCGCACFAAISAGVNAAKVLLSPLQSCESCLSQAHRYLHMVLGNMLQVTLLSVLQLHIGILLTCAVELVQTVGAPQVEGLADVEACLQTALDSSKLTALDTHLNQNAALQQAYFQVGSRHQVALSLQLLRDNKDVIHGFCYPCLAEMRRQLKA